MAIYYVLYNDQKLKYYETEVQNVDAAYFEDVFYFEQEKVAVYGGCSNCGLYDLIYKNY